MSTTDWFRVTKSILKCISCQYYIRTIPPIAQGAIGLLSICFTWQLCSVASFKLICNSLSSDVILHFRFIDSTELEKFKVCLVYSFAWPCTTFLSSLRSSSVVFGIFKLGKLVYLNLIHWEINHEKRSKQIVKGPIQRPRSIHWVI